MSRTRKDGKTRRIQISEAALTVLGTQGVSSLTMERVARLVGLAPSALYRHFENKADMMDAALDLLTRQFEDDLISARESGKDALDILERLLMLVVRRFMHFQAIPRLLFSEEVNQGFRPQREKLRDMLMGFLAQLVEIMKQGQAQGIIRNDLDPEVLGPMFLGVIQPAALIFHLMDGRFDLISQVAKTWEVYAKTLSPLRS